MNLAKLHQGVKAHRRRKRVGRGKGSGQGKTSGRGHKGLLSRSGGVVNRNYEGGQMPYFRRLPKRGFSNARFRTDYAVVNLRDLARFEPGQTVGPQELAKAGLIRRLPRGGIKILGGGKLDRALTVRAHAFSRVAAERIAAGGGKVEIVRK